MGVLGQILVQVYGRIEGGWPVAVLGQEEHRLIHGGDDKLAQAQPAKPGATPAPAPSGGPRVVSPPGKLDKKDTVGGKATYTLDNEISTLLPQPKGESDTPETVKLWVCKGPTLSCNIQTGESDGDNGHHHDHGAERHALLKHAGRPESPPCAVSARMTTNGLINEQEVRGLARSYVAWRTRWQ